MCRRLVHPRHTLRVQSGTYLAKFPGYAYLAVHYGWALGTLFDMSGSDRGGDGPYAGVIILEEDIEIAPDFWSYFTHTAPLLERDPTLLCVSAFNDNGQGTYRGDPAALHRSDFFPGLGWLLTRKLWTELGPKWPNEKGFWDDWLREVPQRLGRASIRPEVSRTYTFGMQGTSVGLFYRKYLANIELNRKPVDFGQVDLRYLLKSEYDPRFKSWLDAAKIVHSIEHARQLATGGRSAGEDLQVSYRNPKELVSFCKQLGLMEDLKAGIPRTGYMGVVLVRIGGKRIFLAPSYPVKQEIV